MFDEYVYLYMILVITKLIVLPAKSTETTVLVARRHHQDTVLDKK